MDKHHQIVIIGAGTAGITTAAHLLNRDDKLNIAIIDPAKKHYYQPAWTLVGAGTYDYKETERDMAELIPDGAAWIREAVTEMNPDEQKVVTSGGSTISYDYLVVCPGIKYDLSLIDGLSETMDKNDVCSNYTDPKYTWEVLQNFKGGTALFTQPATAIKCGGAPQKIMYLAEEHFQKRGLRNKTDVVFATPGSVIFGTEPFKSTLQEVVDRKNIHLRFFHKLTKIDYENKRAHYTITANADEPAKLYRNYKDIGEEKISETEVVIPYDMMHLAPPQTAPDFVKNSKLANEDGWVDVNRYTLQSTRYNNVFSLGDVAGVPTAKTGAAVRKQAPVVVENLMRVMHQEGALNEGYHGYSSCPLVTGYGKMVLAEFNYDNERDSDPMLATFVDTGKEQYSMWLLKKYGLPFMYWNMMLKGRA